MQSPVTPLKDDFSLDLPTFERLLDFHVRTGATAISWPHHKGESLNLTIPERKLFAEAAVRVVNGRIPVTVHVSALAVEDTMELARHAQEIGADGILAITPYFWTPSLEAIRAYFTRLCRSIELPVLSYNSPSYLAGVEITGELMARLIEELPNFAGVKEASFNSEKFLEISRAALAMRPDFAMLTGVEYLLPSVPLGGVGSYSAAGSICPNLCSQLFDACIAGDWPRARAAVQGVVAVASVPRPVSLIAQGRHGDDGPSGRAHARAAADRHQGAPSSRVWRAWPARHSRQRAARLVIRRNKIRPNARFPSRPRAHTGDAVHARPRHRLQSLRAAHRIPHH
jgi:dihydrodipicolinate synthase/N-acetylneuraminate lyase